jgi:hypothetical protein
MMVDTGDVAQAFGPTAFIMDLPGLNPSIECTRAHQKHRQISMGYNITTMVINCSEVQLYDYEVKVKMAPVLEKTPDGASTGKTIQPRPLIA